MGNQLTVQMRVGGRKAGCIHYPLDMGRGWRFRQEEERPTAAQHVCGRATMNRTQSWCTGWWMLFPALLQTHAALGNETSFCMELGDRDKTAISRQLSIINVTQVPVKLSSSLSEALCQKQPCHSSWIPCNSRCSPGEVRRLLQKALISAAKLMFCVILSHFM